MPCLTVQTNVADANFTDDLVKQLSAKVAQATGKPEQYVVVHVSAGQKLFFGGSNEPAAYMELVSIGLQASQTANISNQLMSFFDEKFHVNPSRIYIKFTQSAGNMFGWNKGTF